MSDPPPDAAITVRKQWVVVAVFAGLTVAAELASILLEPADFRNERTNAYSLAAGLFWWLGHAVWLSMDRRRRGLDPGPWRYLVVFLGPLAIWLYLILEYRARALYLIPLTLGIYAVIVVVLLGMVQVLRPL